MNMATLGFIICLSVTLAGICLGQDSPCATESCVKDFIEEEIAEWVELVQELKTSNDANVASIQELKAAQSAVVVEKQEEDQTTATNAGSEKAAKKAAKRAKKAAKKAAMKAAIAARFKNCAQIQESGNTEDGVYIIFPQNKAIEVYCDFTTDGGGWTVFQIRKDGSVDFYLSWDSYVDGFGSPDGEYWLGLKNIRALVEQERQILRFDMEDWDGATAYVMYTVFDIGPADTNYTLTIDGFHGNTDNSMQGITGSQFSTRDRDNDHISTMHCSEAYKGGWWFHRCGRANLNGIYYGPTHNIVGGVNFPSFNGKNNLSMKKSQMKMRPATFYPV